jgi:hypothetical protein
MLMNATESLIASHRAAKAAIDRLSNDVTDADLTAAVTTETCAMRALAEARCCDDDEFFVKLVHILADNTRTCGAPDLNNGFGALATAVAARLSERA